MTIEKLKNSSHFVYHGIYTMYSFVFNPRKGTWSYTWLDDDMGNHVSVDFHDLNVALMTLRFIEMQNLKKLKRKVGQWGVVYEVTDDEMMSRIISNAVIMSEK